jgi:hypothetical protein
MNAARDWLPPAVRENSIQSISAAAVPMQWMVLLVEIGAENWIQDVMERVNNHDVAASGRNISDMVTWYNCALTLIARLGDG